MNFNKQLLLALCNVERYQQIVIEFDIFYEEKISELFLDKLKKAYKFCYCECLDSKYIEETMLELERIIPDTGNYPEIQGTLAQNAIIALYYCYEYILTKKSESIIFALNKSFETIDVIKYNLDKDYDEEKEIEKESIILEKFLEILNKYEITEEMIVQLKNILYKWFYNNIT